MPELLLILGILSIGYLYRRTLKTKASKAFCLIVTLLFVTGHTMNILAIRFNGGKMPVIEQGANWEQAPSIPIPKIVNEIIFEEYLPRAQKAILLTDDPHHMVPKGKEDEVRLKFLVDKHPVTIGGRSALYSLGDVFIFVGTVVLFACIVPIWLISRYLRRKSTP